MRKLRSPTLYEGRDRAPARAFLRAIGHTTEDMREWGFPVAPEESIAYTNAYWSSAAAPGRHGSVASTAEVNFSAV